MNDKEDKQSRLITINNLCSRLSIIIEKRYNTPDAIELLDIIKGMADECREYLKASLS
jgi:hypothetical protein